MIENDSLDTLMQQALSFGYKLLTPSPDMYGGYECCIQDISTRSMNVVMNCRTPIEAAQTALQQVAVFDTARQPEMA
jgi:hypothetical protein